jgi:hypothetical protein
LGVKPDSRVLVTGAPAGFELDCPHHRRAGHEPYDVQLVFCPDVSTLHRRWDEAVDRSTVAVWIAWPKKSSGVPTDR